MFHLFYLQILFKKKKKKEGKRKKQGNPLQAFLSETSLSLLIQGFLLILLTILKHESQWTQYCCIVCACVCHGCRTLLCRLWVGVWRQCVIHSYQGRSWSTTGTLQGTPAMQDGAALPTEPFLAELHLCVLRDYATSSSLVQYFETGIFSQAPVVSYADYQYSQK